MHTLTTPQEQVIEAIAAVITLDLIKKPEHIAPLQTAMEDPTDLNLYQGFRTLVSGRYRRTLAKHEIELPDDLPKPLQIEAVAADHWHVTNLAKGTEYDVTREGFALKCTCKAAECGNYCSHMEAVENSGIAIDDSPGRAEMNFEPTADEVSTALDDLFGPFDSDITAAIDSVTATNETPSADEVNATIEQNDRLETILTEMGIEPTDDQRIALDSMIHWWESTNEPFFLLKGYAGTGKTTIINVLMQYLQQRPLPPRCVFTAPTNKAVKVLENMLSRWGVENLEAMTCARLLALRPRKVENKQEFVPDPKVDPAVDNFDLVVVDECSMVNEDLFTYLQDAAQTLYPRPHRFILMGDPAQLPPVGEAESRTFAHNTEGHAAELQQVVRYSGELGHLAEYLRTHQHSAQVPTVTQKVQPDGNGVFVLNRAQWEQAICAAFTTPSYDADPNYCRVLAYRNDRVDYLNQMIRTALGHTGQFSEGERLVAKSPYSVENSVLWQNSGEGEVISMIEGTLEGWKVWRLTCLLDDGQIKTVPVLMACERKRFDAELRELSQAKRWHSFWGLKEKFADLTYAYALTTHKSQGSTFTNVFVDMADININRRQNVTTDGRRVFERWQLAYVALTRATDKAIVMI